MPFNETQYIVYHGVHITIGKNDIPFADYPAEQVQGPTADSNRVDKFDKVTDSDNVTKRELLSDKSRIRVYYQKDKLDKLASDILEVML